MQQPTDPQEMARVGRRNFKALLTEGILFTMGMAFVDVHAVVPVFIYAYTQSSFMAGLAATLYTAASVVTELFIGPYVKRIKNVPRYVSVFAMLFRPLPLIMIPVLLLASSNWTKAVAFLVIYALLRGGDGLIYVSWNDLFGRSIDTRKRGLLLGYQQLFGGMGALLGGIMVKALLDHPGLTNDQRYAIIFSSSALVLCLSAAALFFARDIPHTVSKEKQNHRQYYRALPAYVRKNPVFGRVIIIRLLSTTANMIAPFVILFGQSHLALSTHQVSTLVYLQIIGGLVGGLIWGFVSSRYGHHRVIQLSQLTGLLLPVAILLLLLFPGPTLPVFLLWPLVMINGMNLNNWAGFMNYTIDVVPADERPVYLLISNLAIVPFSFLTILAGMLIDAIGYLPIFVASALAAALALGRSTKLTLPQGPYESQTVMPLPPAD